MLRWVWTTLLVAGASFSLLGQPRKASSFDFRSTVRDLSLVETTLWSAETYRVVMYEIVNGEAIARLAVPVPGSTRVVEGDGDGAWIGSSDRILRLDRSGRIVDGITAPGVVFDLLVAGEYLYAATSEGLYQYVEADLDVPRRLPTTTGAAIEMLYRAPTLYVADGDATLDVFTLSLPSTPQKIGEVPTVFGARSVEEDGSRILVSNGQQTDFFAGLAGGLTRLIRIDEGTLSWTSVGGGIGYAGSAAGEIKAIDSSDPSLPAVAGSVLLPLTTGGVNEISDSVRSGQTLFFAAGDSGLLTIPIPTETRRPYEYETYPLSAGRGGWSDGVRLWLNSSSAVLTRHTIGSDGRLRSGTQIASEQTGTIVDGHDSVLLLLNGGTATLLDGGDGTVVAEIALPGTASSGVLREEAAFVVASGELLRIARDDLSVTKIDTGGRLVLSVADSSSGVAWTALTESSDTTAGLLDESSLLSETIDVAGAATSGLALSEDREVAVFTFQGLSLIDFDSGDVAVFPNFSEGVSSIGRAGETVYLERNGTVRVFDLALGEVVREIEVADGPARLSAVENDGRVLAAASSSATLFSPGGLSLLETEVPSPSVTVLEDLDLQRNYILGWNDEVVERRTIVNSVVAGNGVAHARVPGSIDLAARRFGWCELNSSGLVTCRDLGGETVQTVQLDRGEDATWHSVHGLSEFLIVTVTSGCVGTGCQTEGIVLDRNLGFAGILPGGVVAMVEEGDDLWTISRLPRSLNRFEISSGAPVLVASEPVASETLDLAVAPEYETVWTLGEVVTAHRAATLEPLESLLEPWEADDEGTLDFADQEMLLSGDVIWIVGRESQPLVFEVRGPLDWVRLDIASLPATSIAIDTDPHTGRTVILTTHSFEIFGPPPPSIRRRAARRALSRF